MGNIGTEIRLLEVLPAQPVTEPETSAPGADRSAARETVTAAAPQPQAWPPTH